MRLATHKSALYVHVPIPIAEASAYAGRDVLAWCSGAVALRSTLCFGDKSAIESAIAELPEDVNAACYLDGHGAIQLNLAPDPERLAAHLTECGGRVAGTVAGCRMADALAQDRRRVALSLFVLYALPSVPVVYFGAEIGAVNNQAHAKLAAWWRKSEEESPADLHRGLIPAETFRLAQKSDYAPLALVQALNALDREGEFEILPAPGHVIGWRKGQMAYVANLSAEPCQLKLTGVMPDQRALRSSGAEVESGRVRLPPYGFAAVTLS